MEICAHVASSGVVTMISNKFYRCANENGTRLVAFELVVDVSGNPNDAQRALPGENLRTIEHLREESRERRGSI